MSTQEDGRVDREISVEVSDHVACVEIRRPPNNFFDFTLIRELAEVYESLDVRNDCRAIVLCSQGKHFCAGAELTAQQSWGEKQLESQAGNLYMEAVRLFRASTPVIAAVHGAAIGGGLGLALSADFRVTCPEARFSANFARLGFHHGFGLSVTLPRIIGPTRAELLLLSGRRINGEDAFAMGLAEELVPRDSVRSRAHALACEIAQSAPLSLREIRSTMRGNLADEVARATEHELEMQSKLSATSDFREGVLAMEERRTPRFEGK